MFQRLFQDPYRSHCQDGGGFRGVFRVRRAVGGAAESRGWNAGAEGRVSPNFTQHDLRDLRDLPSEMDLQKHAVDVCF